MLQEYVKCSAVTWKIKKVTIEIVKGGKCWLGQPGDGILFNNLLKIQNIFMYKQVRAWKLGMDLIISDIWLHRKNGYNMVFCYEAIMIWMENWQL